MRRSRGGFTLIEVMFSVASLAVASLGVLSVLTFGALAGDRAGEFSQATQLGREIVENIRVDRFNYDPFKPLAQLQASGLVNASLNDRSELTAPPFDNPSLSSLPDDPRFKRNIQITQPDVGSLARIQVRVYFQGSKGKEQFVETVAYARSGQ